jgi:drug/metabolite transporter (DMT)-like permease
MGEFFALLSAVFWAGAVVLFKRTGESIPPLALNLFRVVVSAALLVLTMFLADQPPWRAATARDYLLIAASGVIAIAVADTLFHASLNRIGAGLTGIVDSLYPPYTVIFAFLILGERLTPGDLVGLVLVVAAVLVATRVVLPPGLTRRGLVGGILLGAAGMAALSLGIVIVKPVLRDQPVIWVTGMRQLVALVVLTLMALHPRQRAACTGLLRLPWRTLRFALPGTLLGSYLALLCWIAGMKFTSAGTAAILNQTTIVYIVVLARVWLKEPLTKRRLLACGLALVGVAAVVLG